jgi:hypothetical protein
MLRDCPIDHRCMTAITAEEVFARALAMLGGGPVGAGGQISDAAQAPGDAPRRLEAVR